MKKLIVATLLLGSGTLLSAQKTAKIPAYYKPAKSEMYHKGWIDFNKNGIKFRYKSRFICQWDMKKSRPPLSLWRGGLSV